MRFLILLFFLVNISFAQKIKFVNNRIQIIGKVSLKDTNAYYSIFNSIDKLDNNFEVHIESHDDFQKLIYAKCTFINNSFNINIHSDLLLEIKMLNLKFTLSNVKFEFEDKTLNLEELLKIKSNENMLLIENSIVLLKEYFTKLDLTINK